MRFDPIRNGRRKGVGFHGGRIERELFTDLRDDGARFVTRQRRHVSRGSSKDRIATVGELLCGRPGARVGSGERDGLVRVLRMIGRIFSGFTRSKPCGEGHRGDSRTNEGRPCFRRAHRGRQRSRRAERGRSLLRPSFNMRRRAREALRACPAACRARALRSDAHALCSRRAVCRAVGV